MANIVNLYNLVVQAVNDWANDTTDVMTKSEYDPNLNGTVENAEKLNSQAGSYYLDRTNMTGTQPKSTISDWDTEIAGKSNVTPYTPTLDYHPATVKFVNDKIIAAGAGDMLIAVYDTNSSGVVDDAEKLNNQLPSYYLSWNNFSDLPTTLAGYGITDGYTKTELDGGQLDGRYFTETEITTNYAPLASPTLTGTPAAPTAATGTNTTQLATTAFVQQELIATTEW